MAPTSALSIDADCEAHENGDSDCDKASEQEGQPMPGKRGKARRITRRNLFEATAGTALALPLVGIKNNAVGAEVRSDRVRQENALPGTSDWMLTRPIVDEDNSNRSSRIEGFCSNPSVRPGGGENRREMRLRVRGAVLDWVTRSPVPCRALVVHLGVIRALLPGIEPANVEVVRTSWESIERAIVANGEQAPSGLRF